MSIHLTDKEIVSLVSGLASPGDAGKAQLHLDSCPRCRKIVDALSSAVAAQPADSEPGEHVREAVLSHWHKVHNENVKKEFHGRHLMKRFIAGLAAAVATVVAAISVYIFSGIIKSGEGFPLAIKSVAGEVYLDDSVTTAGTPFRKGSAIRTGSTGRAIISTDGYTLYLGGSSYLELSGNSRSSGIRFSLRDGSVISKSHGDITCSFECGRYSIAPSGTEFLLKFFGGKFEVAVLQGKVSVTGGGLHVDIPSGRMWSSGIPDRLELLDPWRSAVIETGTFDITQPGETSRKGEVRKATPQDETGEEKTGSSGIEKTGKKTESIEKTEMMKFNRKLREEISGMKREQRMERRARNRE